MVLSVSSDAGETLCLASDMLDVASLMVCLSEV